MTHTYFDFLLCHTRIGVPEINSGVVLFHFMNSNKLADQITGRHFSISASFRFACQSIHYIGQAGLRVGRSGQQTGEN